MVKEIVERARIAEKRVNLLEFEHKDGRENGWWSFEADENYEPIFDEDDEERAKCQRESWDSLMENPDIVGPFKRFEKRKWRQNARAICECGAEIELWDQYMGACECEDCGTWHNLFGQTLLDPEYWEDEEEEGYGYDY